MSGDDEVTLGDARFSYSEVIDGSKTVKFNDQFSCPTNLTLYVKDKYSFTVTNTATLVGDNTNLTRSATVTVNCEKPQQASLLINNVLVLTASRGGATITGRFTVQNQSGGGITTITLGTVSATISGKQNGGKEYKPTFPPSSCTIGPPAATGDVLGPHEAKTYTFSCTMSPVVPSDATELTAAIKIVGATNQAGQFRNNTWTATSPSFKF